jgi:membrane protein required for beta-lactamase induction
VNFVALLLGLGVERLLTHLFHLREFRWLDPLFDAVSSRAENAAMWRCVVSVIALTVLAVLPVALVSVALAGTLFQIPYFVLAVVVLLFSLGPRDLKIEVDDYCAAVIEDRDDDVQRVSRELLENDPPSDPETHISACRRAVFVQANNRVFAVVFWFLLLGPTGAWLFRVLDLMRRRLAYQYSRNDGEISASLYVQVVRSLHGIFAWLPARLLVLGFALAGSYEGAISAWRVYDRDPGRRFFEATNDVLDHVGNGASGETVSANDAPPAATRVHDAMSLVHRTLWLIWCPAIAVLTLTDWLT